MTTSAPFTPVTTQALHFHAPHKTPAVRPDVGQRVWTVAEVQALFELPFAELLYQAQTAPTWTPGLRLAS